MHVLIEPGFSFNENLVLKHRYKMNSQQGQREEGLYLGGMGASYNRRAVGVYWYMGL